MSLVTDSLITARPVLNAVLHSREQTSGDAEPSAAPSLRHKVARIFYETPYRELRRANCETHGNNVVLKGQVSSFYIKQIAQALAARVAPTSRIRNQLQVVYPECERPRKPL